MAERTASGPTLAELGLGYFRGKRVIILQGPIGPFFQRLARDLRWAGAKVCKVNFNGGDAFFHPTGSVAFRGRMAAWPAFFERLLLERQADVVLMFGDCRPIHRQAHQVADRHGVPVGVFEEGYLRPDYITLECGGVNGHSSLPRSPIVYLNAPEVPLPPEQGVGNTFWQRLVWGCSYYLFSALAWPWFRHYRHHRPLGLQEAWPWGLGLLRKPWYALREHGLQARLAGPLAGRYFLVPLQVHNDAQIKVHSGFGSVEQFIVRVLDSFARHAPADTYLAFKHHPMDRGHGSYGGLIRREARRLGIGERVLVLHDQHLPTLLGHARGVVVVNSTVGLSAVHHNTPVKVCGEAIYDMPGLTYQGALEGFWRHAGQTRIDRRLYQGFRHYLVRRTQLNGSFYKRLPIPGSAAGLQWPGSSAILGNDTSAPGIPPAAAQNSIR